MRLKCIVPCVVGLFAVASSLAGQSVIRREGKGWLEKHGGRYVLHVSGTPYEMGYQHGKLLRDLVRKNVQAISDNQGELRRRTEYKAYRLMRGLMHARLRPHVPERFNEEMRGLADGAGLGFEAVEASNLFPEAFHCTGAALFGKATHDGSLYHVRLLDYMTKAGLQDSAVVIIHEPRGGRRWMNVGFAGFIGSVTGMNDRQITVGEVGGRGLFHWDGMPMAFLVRDVLERAETLREAIEIFRKTARTCEYYYVVSDAKIPDARAVWATTKNFQTARPGESFGFVSLKGVQRRTFAGKTFMKGVKIEADPHRLVFKDEQGRVEGFVAMPPRDTVVISGASRYRRFIDRLMPAFGRVDEHVLMDIVRRPVAMKSNLHSAIFHPATGEAWVAVADSAGHPACNQTYIRYRLDCRASETAAGGGRP